MGVTLQKNHSWVNCTLIYIYFMIYKLHLNKIVKKIKGSYSRMRREGRKIWLPLESAVKSESHIERPWVV